MTTKFDIAEIRDSICYDMSSREHLTYTTLKPNNAPIKKRGKGKVKRDWEK